MSPSARVVPTPFTLTDALPEPLVTFVVILTDVRAGLVSDLVRRRCERRRDCNECSQDRRDNYFPSKLVGRVVIPLSASRLSRSMRRCPPGVLIPAKRPSSKNLETESTETPSWSAASPGRIYVLMLFPFRVITYTIVTGFTGLLFGRVENRQREQLGVILAKWRERNMNMVVVAIP